MKVRGLTLLFGLTMMLGCNKADDDKSTTQEQGSFAEQTYLVVEAGNLLRTETEIAGTGSILFVSPLDSLEAKTNFDLSFTLEEGGSLELVTHANAQLQQGASVLVTRQGKDLELQLKAGDIATEAKVLTNLDASGKLRLAIDVHNDENPSHILAWDGSGTAFGEDDALFNSEVDAETPAQGKGTAWGLILSKAKLTGAQLSAAKFVEEE